ncbi:MAG: glycoside hydrolase family 75 protein [Acetobacteraceae bacterium]
MLGRIAERIEMAAPIQSHFKPPPAFLGIIPAEHGASPLLAFDTALELDTDGHQGSVCGDPVHQSETSLHYLDDGSLDAYTVPYFVLPQLPPWRTGLPIQPGDYAAILFQGHLAFAVFGDLGGSKKLGEGSLELLRQLGQDRSLPDGCVKNVGTVAGALTIVFPKSGVPGDRRNQVSLLNAIDSKGRDLFLAAGGSPSNHG